MAPPTNIAPPTASPTILGVVNQVVVCSVPAISAFLLALISKKGTLQTKDRTNYLLPFGLYIQYLLMNLSKGGQSPLLLQVLIHNKLVYTLHIAPHLLELNLNLVIRTSHDLPTQLDFLFAIHSPTCV